MIIIVMVKLLLRNKHKQWSLQTDIVLFFESRLYFRLVFFVFFFCFWINRLEQNRSKRLGLISNITYYFYFIFSYRKYGLRYSINSCNYSRMEKKKQSQSKINTNCFVWSREEINRSNKFSIVDAITQNKPKENRIFVRITKQFGFYTDKRERERSEKRLIESIIFELLSNLVH